MRGVEVIYEELQQFYAAIESAMGDHAYGGRILYTPSTVSAKAIFIGMQPGGDARSLDNKWPDYHEYADGSARYLAAELRRMVHPDVLRKNVIGTNANFLRARSDAEYKKNIPAATRQSIREFCLPRVSRLIEILEPQTVFCIGFNAFDVLCPRGQTVDEMCSNGAHALIKTGVFSGRPLLAVPHLTGCRIARVDKDRIAERLRDLLS